MAILLSFDIDGTLEVGEPPGGVTIAMVRRAQALGFLIGSCSDRTLGAQRAIWTEHEITVDFVALKQRLDGVRSAILADRYIHIGDLEMDRTYALGAGFDFWWAHEGANEPWLDLLREQQHH